MTLRALFEHHGLAAHLPAFERERVAPQDLADITEQELAETFGVVTYGDRKRFRAMVAGLGAAPARPPPAVREAGARRVVSGVGASAFRFEVASIPPGEFEMGSPPSEEGRDADETQHRVRLTRGFELGIVPVTQALYAAVMGANPSARQGDALPVESVSWFDAVRFCNAVSRACGLPEAYTIGGGDVPSVRWDASNDGFRLPTESEWEYAARAGTRHVYAGGDDLGVVGWFDDNSGNRTQPVGQKAANRHGLYDMSGNVWEWCWDLYGDYPSGALATDPTGPSSGPGRVNRGGSWLFSAFSARIASRTWYPAFYRRDFRGLRLARTLP